MAFQAFDGTKETRHYKNHLPHWRQDGVTCFVTFRLGDSIPQVKLKAWEANRAHWLGSHGIVPGSELKLEDLDDAARHEYHRLFTRLFHEWLDAGYGACWMRRSDCASIVEDALRFFEGQRYSMKAFVVMPNHVHALVTPCPGNDLSEILHSWKSYTSKEMNRLTGHRGSVWQKESYDHLVRSEVQFLHYRRYIRDNPAKANLPERLCPWWDALGEPPGK